MRALKRKLDRRYREFRMRASFKDRVSAVGRGRKVIYALTPPPRLKNIGDHAQVVAIERWLDKHLGLPRLEVDKDECTVCFDLLQEAVSPADLVVLHSGGNLGDRGIWSENARRLLIETFPENRIVSLPQTIFFSDTPTGRTEREKTRKIYARHKQLTIIGRDLQSQELANELFPDAEVLAAPDFVLSLDGRFPAYTGDREGVLFLLRRDDESCFSGEERSKLPELVGDATSLWDTTLDTSITKGDRRRHVEETVRRLQAAQVVVTDRFHSLIFSVLAQTPCVVLPTVDHKLTSAFDWFADVPFVFFSEDKSAVSALVERARKVEARRAVDWNSRHFDPLAGALGFSDEDYAADEDQVDS